MRLVHVPTHHGNHKGIFYNSYRGGEKVYTATDLEYNSRDLCKANSVTAWLSLSLAVGDRMYFTSSSCQPKTPATSEGNLATFPGSKGANRGAKLELSCAANTSSYP